MFFPRKDSISDPWRHLKPSSFLEEPGWRGAEVGQMSLGSLGSTPLGLSHAPKARVRAVSGASR